MRYSPPYEIDSLVEKKNSHLKNDDKSDLDYLKATIRI